MTTAAPLPKIGWCGPLANAAAMHAASLNYIEAQLVPMKLDDDVAFAEAKASVRDLPLPALAMSYLFPHDVRIVGPGTDERRNRAYFDRAVELLALPKARIVVLGNGWTRKIPEGWTQAQAETEFLRTLSWCADALQGSGTTLVIEPLNRQKSNLMNSVADDIRIAKRLGNAEVRGLAGFYYMDEEGEALSAVRGQGEWLAHVHLADTGRLNPGTGSYDYPCFFGHLKASAYAGLLSAECGVIGEAVTAMRRSAEFLRRAWADAQG